MKRPGIALIRPVLLSLLLAACSVPPSGPSLPTPSNRTTTDNEHRTTLIFWHAWPSPDQHILANLIDHYNQSHPQTKIVPQALSYATLTSELQAAVLAGSGPHLILLQNHTIGTLASEGYLLPLDPLIPPERTETLLPTAIQGAQVQQPDGSPTLYGIPLTFDTLALYYHTASQDSPPPDMQHLLSTARTRTTIPDQPWSLAYTLSFDKTIGYLAAFGGHIFDQEGDLILGTEGRAGTQRWLAWMLELHHNQHILAINDSITVDSALKSQKALMTIDWAHTLPTYQALWGNQLGVALLPPVGKTAPSPQPYVQSNVICINAHVKDQDEQQAARDFIHYLISDHAQKTLLEAGKQPVRLDLNIPGKSLEMQAARTFRTQAQQGQAMPNSPLFNQIVRDELERMQLTVLRGLATPPDAVTQTDAAIRERMQARSGAIHPPE